MMLNPLVWVQTGFIKREAEMKNWKFGVIGAGLIADFHAKAVNDIPSAQLIGFCDAGSGRAKKLAKKYSCQAFDDYQKMLKSQEIDIVTIATPSGAHMESTVDAAKAGKHVICEKPLDVTLERIDAMIDAHNKAGTKLGGIFPCRFDDAIIPLQDAINQKRFGTITFAGAYVPWWRNEEYYQDTWHGKWKLDGGGALMNQSIHTIDLLCYLMPPVKQVYAETAKKGHPGIETEDTGVATLKFENGALGLIYGTTASYPGRLRRLEITGTNGTVVYVEDSFSVWNFREEKPEDSKIVAEFGQSGGHGGAADPADITHHNHTKNFKAFIDALESGSEFFINAEQARKPVELILAIYRSASRQKVIPLK